MTKEKNQETLKTEEDLSELDKILIIYFKSKTRNQLLQELTDIKTNKVIMSYINKEGMIRAISYVLKHNLYKDSTGQEI